ncbi:MAG: ATP-binding protein, partial [Clostridia bacterium]|nr:ATP-binding protein [Clostridia bacterium]
MKNFVNIEFASLSENEAFSRIAVAAFAAQLDPTLEELSDIKTAVSEAVTNSVVHGYGENGGTVWLKMQRQGR